jgi:hypothetical protein
MKLKWLGRIIVCIVVLAVLEGAFGLSVIDWLTKNKRESQKRSIIASYYREAAIGKIPMPIDTNSIQVVRLEPGAPLDRVFVETETGKHWFSIKLADGSGTNWVFIPR